MQKILLPVVLSAVMLISSCSSKEEAPQPPSSVKAVQDEVKGKKYKAEKAGVHSLISTDKEVKWEDPKTEGEFEKKTMDEAKSLQLDFKNDTAVTVVSKNKTYEGTYSVDDVATEDQKPGIKLRISYVDEEFKFGDGPASKVTYTYIVEGISNKSLLLVTPQSLNDRKMVLLMNKL